MTPAELRRRELESIHEYARVSDRLKDALGGDPRGILHELDRAVNLREITLELRLVEGLAHHLPHEKRAIRAIGYDHLMGLLIEHLGTCCEDDADGAPRREP